MKKQTNKTKSEATTATPNEIKARQLRLIADYVQQGLPLEKWSDESADTAADAMCEIMRTWGCAVFITTPQYVKTHAEEMTSDEGDGPVILTSDEAKEVCRRIDQDKYLCESNGETFSDRVSQGVERHQKGIIK